MHLFLIVTLGMSLAAVGASALLSDDAASYADLRSPYTFTDALLREVVQKMGHSSEDYLTYPTGRRVAKDYEEEQQLQSDYQSLLDPQEAMTRDQEYLQHSSLWGHQYMTGGTGEGKQLLKPDGSLKNVHQVKTDGVLPAYCSPPNPCPIGYSIDDDCLENFVNSAAFSREYQAAQECMCDTEHMFDCPTSSRRDEINALAESIQNEGLTDHALDRVMENLKIQDDHKSVAKKHHNDNHENYLRELRSKTRQLAQAVVAAKQRTENPYLQGEKLPIVAKKGSKILM